MIKIVKQEPRPAVAQSKLTRRLRQRARPVDMLQQRDLAGPDRACRAKIDAQTYIQASCRDHAQHGTGLLRPRLLPIVRHKSIQRGDRMKPLWHALLAVTLLAVAGSGRAADPAPSGIVVFGAASLTNVLQEIGADYTKKAGNEPRFSFAASSVLARQIEAGTRADVFMSADEEWMDYLATRKLIDPKTRHDVIKNELVLIAPADSPVKLKIAPHFALAQALGKERLATGDPDSVPVGR